MLVDEPNQAYPLKTSTISNLVFCKFYNLGEISFHMPPSPWSWFKPFRNERPYKQVPASTMQIKKKKKKPIFWNSFLITFLKDNHKNFLTVGKPLKKAFIRLQSEYSIFICLEMALDWVQTYINSVLQSLWKINILTKYTFTLTGCSFETVWDTELGLV